MSVPDPGELPVTAPPAEVQKAIYPENAKPVFFGHYWLTGAPVLQAPNALCLDYSAGMDGPLWPIGWMTRGHLSAHCRSWEPRLKGSLACPSLYSNTTGVA
jgi:hypothetical protein